MKVEQAEARIQAVLFEALCLRGLKLEGEPVEALRGIGVHLDKLEPEYPLELWQAALQLIGQRCFPALAPEQAQFELGRALGRGYKDTLLGRVVAAAAPMLGPARVLQRLPGVVNSSRRGRGIEAKIEELGPRERRMVIVADKPMPDFYAGLFHEALATARVTPTVEVAERGHDGFTLAIRW